MPLPEWFYNFPHSFSSLLLLCNYPDIILATLDSPKSTVDITILYHWVIPCPSLSVYIKSVEAIGIYFYNALLKLDRVKATACKRIPSASLEKW